MEIDAMLADSATAAEGKLYVQGGGWNSINVLTPFPIRHPRLGIAALIRVPYTATNQTHTFEIRVENSDGKTIPLGEAMPGLPVAPSVDGKLHQIGGSFTLGRPPNLAPGDDQIVPLAVNLDGLEFPVPDAYAVVISLDGTEVERLPFRVAPIPGMQFATNAG